MFYRGQSNVSGPRIPNYFMRGMEGNFNHHGGHKPPPPNGGGGNGFGTGGLTSFIFGGITGAVLANVFDQKQVNAQAAPFPAQPMPVATPVPYYQPYFSQPMQSQMVNQGQPMQGQMVNQGQPMQSQMVNQGQPMQGQMFSQGQPMQGQMFSQGQPMQGQMFSQGQPMQGQMVNQGQPVQIQSYGTLIGEPQMVSSTPVIPMQTSFQASNGGGMVPYSPQMQPLNPTFASSVPVPMQPMVNAMPYYMFPVQSQPIMP